MGNSEEQQSFNVKKVQGRLFILAMMFSKISSVLECKIFSGCFQSHIGIAIPNTFQKLRFYFGLVSYRVRRKKM